MLRHRLEQGGLRLRHRPVDLVDEHDVRKQGAGLEDERAVFLVEDRETGRVRGLKVGSALDPGELDALDAQRDRAGEDRLRRPGHVLEQHVPTADERGEDEPDLVGLAVDDGLQVLHEPSDDILDVGEASFAWLHRSL